MEFMENMTKKVTIYFNLLVTKFIKFIMKTG